MLSEDENLVVIRRVVSPPAGPGAALVPRTGMTAEHVPAHDRGPDVGGRIFDHLRTFVGFSTRHPEARPPDDEWKHPLVQPHAADAEGILPAARVPRCSRRVTLQYESATLDMPTSLWNGPACFHPAAGRPQGDGRWCPPPTGSVSSAAEPPGAGDPERRRGFGHPLRHVRQKPAQAPPYRTRRAASAPPAWISSASSCGAVKVRRREVVQPVGSDCGAGRRVRSRSTMRLELGHHRSSSRASPSSADA